MGHVLRRLFEDWKLCAGWLGEDSLKVLRIRIFAGQRKDIWRTTAIVDSYRNITGIHATSIMRHALINIIARSRNSSVHVTMTWQIVLRRRYLEYRSFALSSSIVIVTCDCAYYVSRLRASQRRLCEASVRLVSTSLVLSYKTIDLIELRRMRIAVCWRK